MVITVHVKIFSQGIQHSQEIEVADDADSDEIERCAKDAMFEMIEWGWEKTDKVKIEDLSIDEARDAGNICRTCHEKLTATPFRSEGKQRCTNQRCVDCCAKRCQHARSL